MLIARAEAETRERADEQVRRRAYFVTPAIAVAMLLGTLLAGGHYGLGLRDPDGVVGGRIVFVFMLVAVLWALDVVPRGFTMSRAEGRPLLPCMREVLNARWTWQRAAIVLGSIVAFYITYLCYRNLKSYVPLVRPELFDSELLDTERSLFGQHPAVLLQDLLGRGLIAQLLSTVYLLFLTFVPVSIAVALMWQRDMARGLWWLSVMSLNWVLGAVSYFLIPSLGPAFVAPELFSQLPATGAAALQQALLEDRQAFLHAPVGSGMLQSVAAFASLHVSIVLSGAMMAHLLRAPKPLRIGLWVFLCLTAISTVYFGWHYVIDDIGGVAIAFTAVYVGAVLTGWKLEPAPRTAQVTAPAT